VSPSFGPIALEQVDVRSQELSLWAALAKESIELGNGSHDTHSVGTDANVSKFENLAVKKAASHPDDLELKSAALGSKVDNSPCHRSPPLDEVWRIDCDSLSMPRISQLILVETGDGNVFSVAV